MASFWWDQYGPFSPSSDVQGYPEPREVFLQYFRKSSLNRAELAMRLGVREKMVYHMETYGTSLNSIARLRQLCVLLHIPALLFGLAPRPEASSWVAQGYDWPAGDDGFPAPGSVIRAFRQEKGWRQRDLAQALGLSEVTIRHLESNHNLDRISRRQAIVFVLGMPATARALLGLDTLHFPLSGPPVIRSASVPRLSLEEIGAALQQCWTDYYTGETSKAGIVQSRSLAERIDELLPLVGIAERPQWLAAQSLLWQWLTNATRETGDPQAALARARKALDLARQAGIADLVVTARMRQMETAYVLHKEESAVAYAHVLATTTAPDLVVDATRAVACARVLACAAEDREDRSLVLDLLDRARCFGGTDYGLHYDSATYQLRYAETLINLARHAPDRAHLLRQATAMLDTIDGPLPQRRLLGVRTAQAQAAAGLEAYERAAEYANEAVSLGNDMAITTHLPAMTGIYHTLRQTRYANEPLTTRLGLALLRLHQS